MNINVLRSHDNISSAMCVGNLIIERSDYPALEDPFYDLSYYYPKNNISEEIAPLLKKSSFVEIQDATWNGQDIFFPVTSEVNDKTAIDIYKFASKTRTYDIFYSFAVPKKIDGINVKVKVFVLSENSILIQTETFDDAKRDDLMGRIIFDQRIVDTDTLEITEVRDENIRNNGIALIKSVSPTQVMIKTGFSYIDDERLNEGKEQDALIESIFIHTTSKFIADLSIRAETIDAELITSTYFNNYIIHADIKDEYIYFTLYDPNDKSAESVFYNINSTERLTCKNDDVELDDADMAYVIDNTPYVRNDALYETVYLNLKTMEFDLSAMGMDFVCAIGRLILLKKHGKNGRGHIKIYHYPDMKQVVDEIGKDAFGCCKNDEYYIYIQE